MMPTGATFVRFPVNTMFSDRTGTHRFPEPREEWVSLNRIVAFGASDSNTTRIMIHGLGAILVNLTVDETRERIANANKIEVER